jgi:hypothetical protein
MKIAVLSHTDVSGYDAATLMERGHQVTISGGDANHAPGLKPYLECDGCLLLGDEPDLLEIADYMEAPPAKKIGANWPTFRLLKRHRTRAVGGGIQS